MAVSSSSEFAAVEATLLTYLDGLYYGDTERLNQVFHPRAQYSCVTSGAITLLTMDEYMPVVKERASPASQGQKRHDRIIAVEFAGPVTAFARVECTIEPKHFTDFLSLIKLDGQWQIIAKVFHYTLTPQGE